MKSFPLHGLENCKHQPVKALRQVPFVLHSSEKKGVKSRGLNGCGHLAFGMPQRLSFGVAKFGWNQTRGLELG